MGTHSYYIPDSIETPLKQHLAIEAKARGISASLLITKIIQDFLERSSSKESKQTGWASRFSGTWQGKAKTTIRLIEKSRTRSKQKLFD